MLRDLPKAMSTPSLVLILKNAYSAAVVRRYVRTCRMVALEFLGRGFDTRIAPAADVQLADSPVSNAVSVPRMSPSRHLRERRNQKVWNALCRAKKSRHSQCCADRSGGSRCHRGSCSVTSPASFPP
jgi:NADH-quinone oxidoreductase subunit G